MKGQMIKQKGFVRRLLVRLANRSFKFEHNARIAALTDEDLDIIVSEFWEELADCLRAGKRVIFEGWMSFFTKPIKRKCYDMHKNRSWWTWRMRIRNNALDPFRDKAEVDISEDEYLRLKQKEK